MDFKGLETKVASDIIKPASGFIDAILASKIEKVRQWSRERDLEKLMEKENLYPLVEDYIVRTYEKVSHLSTIVFPQDNVPLEDIYEPVKCREKMDDILISKGRKIIDIDLNEYGSCYLVIDDAGMGKSTYSKYLCLNIIKNTDRLPIFFDLSGYDSNINLLENLAHDFDQLDTNFDRGLFNKLILSGKFFIVLDGLDEVQNEFQIKLNSEIKDFNDKKGKASLVVTSRPQEKLPNLVGSIILELEKLTIEQALSIFNKYDHYSQLTIGQKLQQELDRIPPRFMETPLLVGLLYRTYGFNNSIAEKISVFYSEVYEALYKGHDLTKSGFVRDKSSKLSIDQFRQLFRAFSLLFVAKESEEINNTLSYFVDLAKEAHKLCSFELDDPRLFIDDLLVAVPLLTKDGNSYKFIHRSIAEYFSAEFIARSENKSELLNNIYSNRQRFSDIIEYLYEIDPNLYREVISLPIAQSFLKFSSLKNTSEVHQTMSFTEDRMISLWVKSDVVVKKSSRDLINLPEPENFPFQSFSYMYGYVDGVEYIASIAVSKEKIHFIPDGAWLDLTDSCSGDAKTDYTNIRDDENLRELSEFLEPCQWYSINDKEIYQNEEKRCIQELLGRSQHRYLKRVQNENKSIRVIRVKKCQELIASVKKIKEAKSDLSSILFQ